MSLNGQLSDLHLSELIEFFCNQRKTGRLKVDYALAPGVFFIKEGELVDAKVGALNGKDAIFFALTLPSAAFDFNAGMNSSRRTINEPWASVVLEGLRRIDEGVIPQFDVFHGDEQLDDATLDYLNCLEDSKAAEVAAAAKQSDDAKPASDAKSVGDAKSLADDVKSQTVEAKSQTSDVKSPSGDAKSPKSSADDADASRAEQPVPLSMTVEASHGGGRSKALVAGVVAALVLVCAVAAIPVSRRFARKDTPAAPTTQPSATTTANAPTDNAATTNANDTANAPAESNSTDTAAAEEAARREQQQRDARERARKLREEAAKNAAQDQTATSETAKPAAAPALGPKTVRVSISYDEAGRVTQASAVGTSPGAEAYAATAVRIARSRHFAPGKAGSTVVTIPIN
jgi:hypothetical protein